MRCPGQDFARDDTLPDMPAPMRKKKAPRRLSRCHRKNRLRDGASGATILATGAGERTGDAIACACAGVMKRAGRQHQSFASLQ